MNMKSTLLPDRLRAAYLGLLSPIVDGIAGLQLHPNTLTTISFIFGCAGGVLIAAGHIRLASALLLLSGIFDNIDGHLARKTGKATKFGALFDSTLDRYSETIYFIGLIILFIRSGPATYITAAAAAIGLTGSFMVSYVRARAEGLGYSCDIGFIQRPERVVLLGVGGLLHVWVLIAAVWMIAVLSNVTAVQRLIYVWKTDQKPSGPAEGKD
jgi:CDP-diacylglycerol--glycerol-3-phosphate 3-phosphatidyltransferase